MTNEELIDKLSDVTRQMIFYNTIAMILDFEHQIRDLLEWKVDFEKYLSDKDNAELKKDIHKIFDKWRSKRYKDVSES